MVSNRSFRSVLTAIAIAIILTSCTAVRTSNTLAGTDFVGLWELSTNQSESVVQLLLNEDGTFVTSGWPRNLACKPYGEAASASDIDWVHTVEMRGVWKPGRQYDMYFNTSDFTCSGSPQLEPPSLMEVLHGEGASRLRLYLNGFNDEWNFVTFKKVS